MTVARVNRLPGLVYLAAVALVHRMLTQIMNGAAGKKSNIPFSRSSSKRSSRTDDGASCSCANDRSRTWGSEFFNSLFGGLWSVARAQLALTQVDTVHSQSTNLIGFTSSAKESRTNT